MTVATLKRMEKVNPLNQIKPVKKLDNIKDLDVDHMKRAQIEFDKLAIEYNEHESDPCRADYDEKVDYLADSFFDFSISRDEKLLKLNPTTILTPKEIREYEIINPHKYDDDNNYIFGYFISRLIQNSYEAGHNNFDFEINKLGILGYELTGKKDNLIKITIGDNWGDHTFEGVNHINLNININRGDSTCFSLSDCKIKIDHNLGDDTIYSPEGCIIEIGQNVGKWCVHEGDGGFTKNTIMIGETKFSGDKMASFGSGIEGSIFKSPNKETLDLIIKESEYGHPTNSLLKHNNKFYLIKPNGEEILYRK